MASNKKIIELITGIKTIYSYYAKDADIELLVKTWSMLLKDYPDQIVEAAFYKCLQTCKVPPTPADVIERINDIRKVNEPSNESLWVTLENAVREASRQLYYFRFNYVDESGVSQGDRARAKVDRVWQGLPEKIKVYFANQQGFINYARNYDDKDLKYEKNRFLNTMPNIEKRLEDKKAFAALGVSMNIKRLEE